MDSYCPLCSTISTTHDPHNRGYVDWPSWATYLFHHPGYKDYQLPADITKNGCHWGSWVTFSQKIEAIQARVGPFTDPRELFRSKDFLVMYKHPDYYKDAVLDYLVDERHTLEEKKIAIYASSRLYLWKKCYQLYQEKKIDALLLEWTFSIHLGNFIAQKHTGNCYENPLKTLHPHDVHFLERVTQEIPKESVLHRDIQSILHNNFPEIWWQRLMFSEIGHLDYYTELFSFYDLLTDAVRDERYSKEWGSAFGGIEHFPYFLVIMEHPQNYYPTHFELSSTKKDGIAALRDGCYTNEEKSMSIFGMSQFGMLESSGCYACMIENAVEWYKNGHLSLQHLYQLFTCNFPTFYKYPFFILDYKDKSIQEALDKFMAEPALPCGLKDIARKVKNGTLATKEEMAYMEGYRQFRKTHFTLYETIPPRGR
ncbi:MAG: hypothetical protein K2X94_01385 [Amoebophilaceae bacterium]|nr:hypothetical protein [Amoebophilaceae bacterium]